MLRCTSDTLNRDFSTTFHLSNGTNIRAIQGKAQNGGPRFVISSDCTIEEACAIEAFSFVPVVRTGEFSRFQK